MATETKPEFKVRDIPGIWDLTFKQDWVVEGLIPTNAVTMLSGESGSGKSTLTLALADAISQGLPFLGKPTLKKPVLIMDRENGLPVYHERLARFNVQPNPDLIFWGGWNSPVPPQPSSKALRDFVEAEQPVIIFDSFIAFHPGSEMDATETRKYMDEYRRLASMGATLILIHHVGKSAGSQVYRGSSDIKASVDVLYVLKAKSRNLALLELKPDKVREGALDPITFAVEGDKFVLIDHEFIKPDDKDWKAVLALVGQKPGLKQKDLIAELPKISPERIRKVLKAGELNRTFTVEKGANNASHYFVCAQQNAH